MALLNRKFDFYLRTYSAPLRPIEKLPPQSVQN